MIVDLLIPARVLGADRKSDLTAASVATPVSIAHIPAVPLAHIKALQTSGAAPYWFTLPRPVFSIALSQLPIGITPAYLLSGGTMLRAEMQDSEKGLMVRLEGRLAGHDAEHLRMLVTRRNIETGLVVVDLTEVTFIDSAGEATLSFFSRLGAKFVAADAYVLDVCERLYLPLARNRKWEEAAPLVKRSRTADHG